MKNNTKRCPRCHEELNVSAKFCSNCGWEFRRKRAVPKKRRWKEEHFQDVSFREIDEWLDMHNGNIEIVNCRGNTKYDTSGFIIKSRDWFVQYLTIRYYDDEKANKQYELIYNQQYDSLLSSGAKRARNNVEKIVDGRKVIFSISRSSHYSGGGSREYSCYMAICEL